MSECFEVYEGELLTAKEVAERLRVSPRTVRRWASAGELPAAVRLGKRSLRWRASAIGDHVAARASATDS